MKGYPRFFHPLLWATLAMLYITGLVLGPSALEMRLEWEMPWRLGAGLRLPVAAAHALLAFIALLFLGALSALHVRTGLRRQRSVISGLTLLSSFAVLTLSALGIYYLGEERAGAWASVVHLSVGILVALPLASHVLSSRRLRAANPQTHAQSDRLGTAPEPRARPAPAYSSAP
jgi:hypothetical protein